jgi:Cft2 family RNA processing exonuclease
VTHHVTWDRGVSLVGHGLWLDPTVVRDLAFVSHAHTDHTRRHRLALLTAETLALVGEARRPHDNVVLALGEPHALNGSTVTLHSAGHMLGSAQLLFEHEGVRLLYTGDLKLRTLAGLTPIPAAEVLVIESTYGQPHFRFPDPAAGLEAVATWCRGALDARVTPVLLANALGKAQELMLALARYGFRFALESRCLPHALTYEATGVRLPDFTALTDDPEPDRVVIAPPAGKEEVRRLRRYRTLLVSGWACDRSFSSVFGADTTIAYSDHCDFDELLEVVRRSGASRVYTVHGYSQELARHLRRHGVRASALHVTEQLALAL